MIPRNIVYALVTFAVIVLHTGCSSGVDRDERLQNVVRIVSDNPREALDSLAAIDKSALSESDRHYFDFLKIKATDKAFIEHESDSLILNVIDYAKSHQSEGYYPEALYYAGRVYHDLGDYPTALEYYQMSLDRISKNENSPLKAHVLSQMGGLLNSLRLYDQAILYISESIKTDSVRCDTINLIYDLELIGSIHHHAEKYKMAEENFNRARILSRQISHADTLTQSAYLAAIKYELHDTDSALYFIRQSLKRPDSTIDNISLAYASLIYSKIGVIDSAWKYAQRLIETPNPANHRIGYRMLLSRELEGYVNRDSIPQYSRRYWDVVESYLNKNGDHAALIQNSFYNYQVHQRERIKSEMSNAKLRNWLTGTLIVVLLLSLWVIYYRYRNKSHLLRLHAAIDQVAALRLELEKSNEDVNKEYQPATNESSFDMESAILSKYVQNETELRVRLCEELLSIRVAGKKKWTLPDILLNSDAYKRLMLTIKEGKIIKDADSLWDEIDEAVSMAYPEFKDRLTLLAGGKLKPSECQTALLIKCGVTPTNMAVLIGRSKATIAYRRENLGLKLFDKKTELKVVDDIIRLI